MSDFFEMAVMVSRMRPAEAKCFANAMDMLHRAINEPRKPEPVNDNPIPLALPGS